MQVYKIGAGMHLSETHQSKTKPIMQIVLCCFEVLYNKIDKDCV